MAVLWRRPSTDAIHLLVRQAASQDLTYLSPGATAGSLPAGYRHIRREISVGTGEQTWRSAIAALDAWKAHTNGGATVTPANAPLREGTVVVVTAPVGPLWVVAPCRIVYTTTLADRYGFAYGTLPDHPEQGEEAFHVVRRVDGTVLFRITAFSRPASLLTRLGGPLSSALQDRATERYLDGLRSATSGTA